jgi:putative SOS response-associated peptidase YedK
MGGRYATNTVDDVQERYRIDRIVFSQAVRDFFDLGQACRNAAPTQLPLMVVETPVRQRKLRFMRWGLASQRRRPACGK